MTQVTVRELHRHLDLAADELLGWMETAYLLRSPKNARRLLEANSRAEAGEVTPLDIDQLRERLGIQGT